MVAVGAKVLEAGAAELASAGRTLCSSTIRPMKDTAKAADAMVGAQSAVLAMDESGRWHAVPPSAIWRKIMVGRNGESFGTTFCFKDQDQVIHDAWCRRMVDPSEGNVYRASLPGPGRAMRVALTAANQRLVPWQRSSDVAWVLVSGIDGHRIIPGSRDGLISIGVWSPYVAPAYHNSNVGKQLREMAVQPDVFADLVRRTRFMADFYNKPRTDPGNVVVILPGWGGLSNRMGMAARMSALAQPGVDSHISSGAVAVAPVENRALILADPGGEVLHATAHGISGSDFYTSSVGTTEPAEPIH